MRQRHGTGQADSTDARNGDVVLRFRALQDRIDSRTRRREHGRSIELPPQFAHALRHEHNAEQLKPRSEVAYLVGRTAIQQASGEHGQQVSDGGTSEEQKKRPRLPNLGPHTISENPNPAHTVRILARRTHCGRAFGTGADGGRRGDAVRR